MKEVAHLGHSWRADQCTLLREVLDLVEHLYPGPKEDSSCIYIRLGAERDDRTSVGVAVCPTVVMNMG